MTPIEPRPDEPPMRLDSRDLQRLARSLSGRIQVECKRCRQTRKLNVRSREMRLGSSPNLSEIDPNQPGRPRIILYCVYCYRIIGYIQGDEWSPEDLDAATTEEDASRWNHLEFDEDGQETR